MIDAYDRVQDARSEARYTDDPSAEPELTEVKDASYTLYVNEPAGFADKWEDFRG